NTIGAPSGPTDTGSISLNADRMSLGSLTLKTVGTGTVTLAPYNNATAIAVGSGGADAPGTLGIDNTELGTVFSANGLTVGSFTNSGGLTLTGSATPTNVSGGTIKLISGG